METLEELSWMDAPSKEKAREKVTTPSHTHTHTHPAVREEGPMESAVG